MRTQLDRFIQVVWRGNLYTHLESRQKLVPDGGYQIPTGRGVRGMEYLSLNETGTACTCGRPPAVNVDADLVHGIPS